MGAGCLSRVGTYLPGTVLQGYRLFKRCWNLPALNCVTGFRLFKQCQNLPGRHCVAGVQAVYVVSEPTLWALCCRGAGCLSGVGINQPCTLLQGCSLFEGCLNLTTGHCVAGVQAG